MYTPIIPLDVYHKMTRDEQSRAISAQNEKTREQVAEPTTGRALGFTYQTLGGFYRGVVYNGIGAGPFATRDRATRFVRGEKISCDIETPETV
jgi:hypothetical protein